MREGEVDDDKGMLNDVENAPELGGRETLNFMREGISVCVVVVVLMLVVGVVVLMIVVGVVCLVAVELDCSGVVDIFVLGGVFVVGCIARLVLWCSNDEGIFCNDLA